MMVTFKDQLDYYIKDRHIDSGMVAAGVGVSRSMVNLWLNGRKPSLESCERLDRFFKTQTGFWATLATHDYGELKHEGNRAGVGIKLKQVEQMMSQGMDAMQISNHMNIPLSLAQSYVSTVRKRKATNHVELTGQKGYVPMSMIPSIVRPQDMPKPSVTLTDVQEQYEYDAQLTLCTVHVSSANDFVTLHAGEQEETIEGTLHYDSIQKLVESLKWLKEHHDKEVG